MTRPTPKPAPVKAADPNAPAGDPVPFGGGKFQFIPPPADTWEPTKQSGDRVMAYTNKSHDAVVALQVLPPDMVIDTQIAQAIVPASSAA